MTLLISSCATAPEKRDVASLPIQTSSSLKQLSLLRGDFCPAAKNIERKNLLVVLNWNVLKVYHEDGKNRLPEIHKIIADISPDFIGLQEVYGKRGQESSPDVLNDFKIPLAKLGLNYWYSDGDQILVRSPDSGFKFTADTRSPHRPQKWARAGGLDIHLGHPDVPNIRFFNVHLSSKLGGFVVLSDAKKKNGSVRPSDVQYALSNSGVTERVETLRAVSNYILKVEAREENPSPAILVGDFNSSSSLDWGPHNPYLLKKYPFLKSVKMIPWLESKMASYDFVDIYRKLHPKTESKSFKWGDTWSPMGGESVPRDRIDYVYFRNASKQKITPLCSQVIGENPERADLYVAKSQHWPSDHRAIVTVFRLGSAK